jgi:putative aminopeptidase FrvX
MFNEELLIEVLGWQAESSKEKEQITSNLLEKLAQISTELFIEEDTHGNIYVTKGKADLYPCIVSHLDQVHKFAPNKTIIKNGDYLLAFDGAKQVGTGGDRLNCHPIQ